MSSVSVPRRFALLLLIAVASVVIFKCSYFRYKLNREVLCRTGNYSRSHPLICIDEHTLTASPSPAYVYDTESKNGVTTGRAVTVHWFSQRTADLHIEMRTSACTDKVACDGLGHCSATMKKLDVGEKERRCHYGIAIRDKSVDPEDDIILTPCCH